MNFDLRKDALSHMLIVAHRGAAGGNIPCNTLKAYDAAICQGADMVEIDVTMSTDGKLYAFHPGMEHPHLRCERRLDSMESAEIEPLRFVNQDGTPTDVKVSRLEEVFEHLRGRCYINVDKYWENIAPITKVIRDMGVAEQILVKTPPREEAFAAIEEYASDINYMAVLTEKDEWTDRLLKRKLNYVGAEVLFRTEESEFASREYVEKMNAKNLIVWVNSIVYDYRSVLAAGHNDDISVIGRADEGWGWLMDRGYNCIQTDWPLALKFFAEKYGK